MWQQRWRSDPYIWPSDQQQYRVQVLSEGWPGQDALGQLLSQVQMNL